MKKMLLTFLMLFAYLAFAGEPQIGVNFDKTVQVVPTDNKDKIEVAELFWYGCIHCYQMDPILSDWAKKLPKDVYFKRIPAIPRPDWAHKNPAHQSISSGRKEKELGVYSYQFWNSSRFLRIEARNLAPVAPSTAR